MARRRNKRDTDPKKVIGYIRVSTDEQALGPDAQRDALNAWCERHEARLLAIHEDIGVLPVPLPWRSALASTRRSMRWSWKPPACCWLRSGIGWPATW